MQSLYVLAMEVGWSTWTRDMVVIKMVSLRYVYCKLTICCNKMLLKSTSVKRHLEVKKVVVVFSKKLWDDCYSFR